MVRKVITVICCVCLLFCGSRSAHALTAEYDNIPTAVLDIARGTVEKHPINTDYVLFAWNEQYHLMIGDLRFDEESYRFDKASDTTVIYTIARENYNSGYYIFLSNCDYVDVSNGAIVYSNLGMYPDLIERGTYYEMFISFVGVVGLLLLFILRIFRRR